MSQPDGLHVEQIEQTDERLGRQIVHDPRSRDYPVSVSRDVSTITRSFRHRIFGPHPVPRQVLGCCTGVDQCVKANARGNRQRGVILAMDTAEKLYSRATELDPWQGSYPPTDTGSSGLAACKAAKEAGIITEYRWIFGGVDQVLAVLRERPVGVGTRWHDGMFRPDRHTLLVEPTGPLVGGHQWTIIGWSTRFSAFEGLCWWGHDFGSSGMFRIRRAALAELLADSGDAHITYRAGANG